MHCPYCQNPVREESPACPRCGLDMDKATAFFGAPPRLIQGVSDSAGVLSAGDTRTIRRAVREFERRFPQAGFTVAFMSLAKDTPAAAYAWWVFNRSNPAGELRQASANRHVFLLVDTASRGAWLTVGYGLEPFVGAEQLRQCVEKGQPYFARGEFAAGVAALLKETEAVLRATVAALPRIYGLPAAMPGPEPEPAAWQ